MHPAIIDKTQERVSFLDYLLKIGMKVEVGNVRGSRDFYARILDVSSEFADNAFWKTGATIDEAISNLAESASGQPVKLFSRARDVFPPFYHPIPSSSTGFH